ncbi:MAG: YjjG family noncanonical pyrimidine nucleotidase [Flavobacteriales bacterium]|nr:YjjG family noncanonical pyrimidine nucleotidase [Flavobacteriales bacterium]
MNRYAHLFFDLDHTLWDFEANSRATLRELYGSEALEDLGVPDADAFIEVYEEVNSGLWQRYENGHLDKAVLRVLRFRNSLLQFGVKDNKLAVRMGRAYVELCPKKPALMDGALPLLEDLQAHYRMHIITNGFEEVQHVKLAHSAIRPFFDVVLTSEQAQARKPHPRIFEVALQRAKATAANSLMIGDSILADIQGARSAGWDQAHFAPGKEHDPQATYGLQRLDDLRRILL